MTVPLVILGVLSVAGGWINVPALLSFLGPVGALEHWLEPVVGDSQLRVTNGVAPHVEHSVEYTLVGAAVAVAVIGIAIALQRLRPARLVPKASAVEEQGIERVLADKYYVDEAYDAAVVQPIRIGSQEGLWRGVDVQVVDGAVNGTGALVAAGSTLLRRLQTGSVRAYAGSMFIGVVVILGYYLWR